MRRGTTQNTDTPAIKQHTATEREMVVQPRHISAKPCCLASSASVSVRAWMPALEVAYAPCPSRPPCVELDPTFTIVPRPCACIAA